MAKRKRVTPRHTVLQRVSSRMFNRKGNGLHRAFHVKRQLLCTLFRLKPQNGTLFGIAPTPRQHIYMQTYVETTL